MRKNPDLTIIKSKPFICHTCGKQFTAKHNREKLREDHKIKFCSRECANAGKIKRVVCTCQKCGKEFSIRPSELKKGRGVFCSYACSGASKRAQIQRVCKYCGKEFTLKRSLVERYGGGNYCSKECKDKGLPREGENNPRYKGRVMKLCEQCGKFFEIIPARGDTARFCSKDCKDEYFRGEHAVTWNEWSSYYPYCEKFNEIFKERVRLFFGNKCVECGRTHEENKVALSVHHVYKNKNTCCDDSPRYFVPLCKRCHANVHFTNKINWQTHFADMIDQAYSGECYYTLEEYVSLLLIAQSINTKITPLLK